MKANEWSDLEAINHILKHLKKEYIGYNGFGKRTNYFISCNCEECTNSKESYYINLPKEVNKKLRESFCDEWVDILIPLLETQRKLLLVDAI